jgi:hypothetical protein
MPGGVRDGACGYGERDSGGDHRRQDLDVTFRVALVRHGAIFYLSPAEGK